VIEKLCLRFKEEEDTLNLDGVVERGEYGKVKN